MMQTTVPTPRPSPRMWAVVLAAVGSTLIVAFGFALVLSWQGLLFSGLSTCYIIFNATVAGTVLIPLTAFIVRRLKRHYGWRALLIEAAALAIVVVGVSSWLDTRQMLRIFMEPSPVPGGLRVHQGRSVLFDCYMHFTGPPAVIASLLKSKGLVEVRADLSDTNFTARQRSGTGWDWWQPNSMPNPRFFYVSHDGKEYQGWCEGWWVSGETNEVYAYSSW